MQLQEIEEAMNPDLENGNNSIDDYFPKFNQNLDQASLVLTSYQSLLPFMYCNPNPLVFISL